MKKKIGQIEIYDKATQETVNINIWGSLFKSEDTKRLYSGLYFTLTPKQIKEYWDYVDKVMQRSSGLSIKYKAEFYGDFYSIGIWGLSDKINIDYHIQAFKFMSKIETPIHTYSTKITKDFQYVIDANLVEKI